MTTFRAQGPSVIERLRQLSATIVGRPVKTAGAAESAGDEGGVEYWMTPAVYPAVSVPVTIKHDRDVARPEVFETPTF